MTPPSPAAVAPLEAGQFPGIPEFWRTLPARPVWETTRRACRRCRKTHCADRSPISPSERVGGRRAALLEVCWRPQVCFLSFGWHFENLHAVVIAHLEVHGTLSQFLSNSNYRLLCFPEQSVVAANRHAATFVPVESLILWIKPLPFGNAFVRATTKLQRKFIQDLADLLRGHFAAIVEAQRD